MPKYYLNDFPKTFYEFQTLFLVVMELCLLDAIFAQRLTTRILLIGVVETVWSKTQQEFVVTNVRSQLTQYYNFTMT